ncbi:arsenic metallochaperone ArsD family protein [Pseudoramibacter alactolyticus]|uniref:arsenic metallochaperone ArsD family protein n=1 Tax=Pseudoramibacter alactolyticus TaxID=113287 RepID=UPI002353CB56|nr:arsenic metallochaperone ArsD family protein [Pseudoramibacter alactolyticus]
MCINIYNPIGCDPKSPAVLQINVMVNSLKRAGYPVHLINFEEDPVRFTSEKGVESILLTDGPDAFPVTVVDGEVYQKNYYPDYAQLLKWSAAH